MITKTQLAEIKALKKLSQSYSKMQDKVWDRLKISMDMTDTMSVDDNDYDKLKNKEFDMKEVGDLLGDICWEYDNIAMALENYYTVKNEAGKNIKRYITRTKKLDKRIIK